MAIRSGGVTSYKGLALVCLLGALGAVCLTMSAVTVALLGTVMDSFEGEPTRADFAAIVVYPLPPALFALTLGLTGLSAWRGVQRQAGARRLYVVTTATGLAVFLAGVTIGCLGPFHATTDRLAILLWSLWGVGLALMSHHALRPSQRTLRTRAAARRW